MAITRTINYTQNVPASLGFSAYINPVPSRNIRVTFDFSSSMTDAKMGTINFPDVTGVTKFYGNYSPDTNIFGTVYIEGAVADVNTALNGAEFLNHFYEAETLDQVFTSQNPALPTDEKGELCIQINPSVVHGLTVGSFCRISSVTGNSGTDGEYQVTAIDSTNSPTRLWLMFRGDWIIDDTYYGSSYKNAAIGAYLQTTGSVNIAPIIDVSYCNPHGAFTAGATITNADTLAVEETGTITFNGSFFIAEPSFTTPPTSTVAVTGLGAWSSAFSLGAIAQADDNYQSVQVLIKCLDNDPMYLGVASYASLPGYPSAGTTDQQLQFIGDAINAKAILDTPAYISDTSYGIFGVVQVDERVSTALSSGVVRWHFFGSPDQCNDALGKITYYRPPTNSKDFTIETRIVNGKTRIYSSRGK